MSGGAFQTSREIFENPIWKNIVEFRLFFLIYGSAVYAEEGYRVSDDLVLQRGQWLRSTRKLQDDLTYIENRQVKTYSTSVINRCIKKLEAMQRICTKTHELGTVFTVLNYEQYQGFMNYKKDNLEQNLEHCWNNDGTVLEQQRNNNKKDNKEKKEKKVINKISYAEFVSLTEEEYQKLIEDYGEDFTNECIQVLNTYKGASGKRYKSDYLATLNWVVKRVTEDRNKVRPFPRRDQNRPVGSNKPNLPVVSDKPSKKLTEEEMEAIIRKAEILNKVEVR